MLRAQKQVVLIGWYQESLFVPAGTECLLADVGVSTAVALTESMVGPTSTKHPQRAVTFEVETGTVQCLVKMLVA